MENFICSRAASKRKQIGSRAGKKHLSWPGQQTASDSWEVDLGKHTELAIPSQRLTVQGQQSIFLGWKDVCWHRKESNSEYFSEKQAPGVPHDTVFRCKRTAAAEQRLTLHCPSVHSQCFPTTLKIVVCHCSWVRISFFNTQTNY